MTGVNPHNFHASMFTVYFLLRRLVTGIILIALIQWPFFQCAFLMIFSTINFIYISTVHPMETRRENWVEIFNEICILTCAHLYNMFLRSEGGPAFLGHIGWAFMGVSAFNILGNLALVIYETALEAFRGCAGRIE